MRKTVALQHLLTQLPELVAGELAPEIAPPPRSLAPGQVWRCVSAQVLPGYGGWVCHSFWAIEEEIEDALDFSEE